VASQGNRAGCTRPAPVAGPGPLSVASGLEASLNLVEHPKGAGPRAGLPPQLESGPGS
jgi:hypothetical protein